MHHLSIDIETYSSIDISSAGAYRYTQSPDFQIMLLAYAIDDKPVELLDLTTSIGQTGLDMIRFLINHDDFTCHAYNAAFEWWCLSAAGFQSPINRWQCTMAHAYYCGYAGGLAAVGEAVGLPADKQKSSTGKALINLFCKPQTTGKRQRILPHHEPAKWDLFKQYCIQDVEAERAIEQRLSPWPMPEREQKLWQLDCTMNANGVMIDRQLVEGAIYCGGKIKQELLDEAVSISGLSNPNSTAKLTKWLSEELSEEVSDVCKDTVTDLLDKGVSSEKATRMLEIRQQLGKSSITKYDAMKAAAGSDDRVRGLMQYYGASGTGRWAGRLVQIQNLPRNYLDTLDYARELVKAQRLDDIRLMYGNVPDTLSQLIRTAFIPAPGKRYVIADFSAIEARVIAWLAGEQWVMDVFAGDGKIYEATASSMFRTPIELIKKGNPEYTLRAKGKVATLACGFGGGKDALIRMGALDQGLTADELPDIVYAWRAANPNIVQLWHTFEDAAIDTVQTGKANTVKGITFALEGAGDVMFLTIALPVGRKLFYAKPTVANGKFNKPALYYIGTETGKRRGTVSTWGGTLVENCVQGIARDCLAAVLLRLDYMGYQTVFHVHDEVIIECEDDILPTVLEIMSAPIEWAPGLLLRGAGFVTSEYYMKD